MDFNIDTAGTLRCTKTINPCNSWSWQSQNCRRHWIFTRVHLWYWRFSNTLLSETRLIESGLEIASLKEDRLRTSNKTKKKFGHVESRCSIDWSLAEKNNRKIQRRTAASTGKKAVFDQCFLPGALPFPSPLSLPWAQSIYSSQWQVFVLTHTTAALGVWV